MSNPEGIPESPGKSFFFFLMWTILKVFIEFVTVLLLFCFGCLAPGMWDLSFWPGTESAPHALEGEVLTLDHQGSPLGLLWPTPSPEPIYGAGSGHLYFLEFCRWIGGTHCARKTLRGHVPHQSWQMTGCLFCSEQLALKYVKAISVGKILT